jgi:hypothetical protein
VTADHYRTLGVPRDATPVAIRQAYRAWVRVNRPDKDHSQKVRVEFTQINKAFNVLRDPVKRAQYDEYLALREQDGRRPQDTSNIEKFVSDDRAFTPPWPPYTKNDFIEVEVDLDEYDSSSEQPLINALTRLLGTLLWLGAAGGCYFVAPYITRPFQDVTTFGGDIAALIAALFRLVVYIAIPACVIMGGYTLFRSRQN